jgi:hypothetical protein
MTRKLMIITKKRQAPDSNLTAPDMSGRGFESYPDSQDVSGGMSGRKTAAAQQDSINPDILTRGRGSPKQNKGGGRKPTLNSVKLIAQKEQRNHRTCLAVACDVVERSGLGEATDLGITSYQSDGRTRLRMARGEGWRWADPHKPTRHIRASHSYACRCLRARARLYSWHQISRQQI